MERKISIPAKLKGTQFFEKLLYLADCIDINCEKSSISQSWEMRDYHTKLVRLFIDQWEIAKSALELLTGKTYAFSRTDEYYGIVNEADENDWLYKAVRNSQLNDSSRAYRHASGGSPHSACSKQTEREQAKSGQPMTPLSLANTCAKYGVSTEIMIDTGH